MIFFLFCIAQSPFLCDKKKYNVRVFVLIHGHVPETKKTITVRFLFSFNILGAFVTVVGGGAIGDPMILKIRHRCSRNVCVCVYRIILIILVHMKQSWNENEKKNTGPKKVKMAIIIINFFCSFFSLSWFSFVFFPVCVPKQN